MIESRREMRKPMMFQGAARIAAVFLCLLPTTQYAIAASPVARQSYSITDFDTIRLEAPIEVTLVTGKGASANGIGDRDTLDALSLQINSRTLVVRLRDRAPLGGSGGKLRAPTRLNLTTGQLSRATVTGAGILTVDALKGASTEAALRGSGKLTIAGVDADKTNVSLFGSGTLVVTGKALAVTASLSGSGRLDAKALDARRIRIDSEGSVDAVTSARDEAVVSAAGTGSILISGSPICTVRKVGSATISCGGTTY